MLVTLSSTVGFKLPEEREDALDFEKSMGKEWTKVRETETCVIFSGETSAFGMLYSRYRQIFAENHCNCAGTGFDPNVKRDCVFYRTEENMGAHDPYCKRRSGMPYDLQCSNCKDYITSGWPK